MRKGGFNMYLTKKKPGRSFYKNFEPRFPKHKDIEIQAYVASTVGNDIADKMQSTIRCMTQMIIQGFSEEAN